MTFTVTYRDRTGARREECVEAESRDAAFAAMKARGIVPAAVRAGTKKPRNTRNTRNAVLPYIIAIAFVLLLGGGVWWWFGGVRGAPALPSNESAKTKAMPKEALPSPSGRPVTVKTAIDEPKQLPLNVKRDHSELTREELLAKVPHWAYTVEDRKRVDPGYAKRHERFLERQEKNPWKTYADNSLAMLLFSDGSMGLMPPFNKMFTEAFLKSLETPIIVSKDDPPELQEQKRELMETKVWLKEQMDGGKDIVEILNEEYTHKKKILGLRDSLRRELYEIQRTAKSLQEVEDYIAAANVMLKEAGDKRTFKFPTIMTRLRLQREANHKGEGEEKK